MENQTPSTRQSMQWLIVIPILLLVFWLGLSRMLTDALWWDEILTHIYSGTGGLESQSIFDILYETATNDRAWPPLYYLFNYAWSQFSGNSLLSGHLLSAYFGLLAVALTYRFGKELIGSTGGLFAALLVGTSGLFVYFLHETRAYTMYIFSFS